LEAADWIGRLPNQGRRRTVTTPGNLERIKPLVEEGKTDREIAAILTRRGYPVGYRSVGNLRKTYL